MDILKFKIEKYKYEPETFVKPDEWDNFLEACSLLTIKGVDGDMEIDIRIKNPTRNALHNCMAAYDSRYSEDSIIIRLEGNHEL